MVGDREGRENRATGDAEHAIIRVRNDLRFTPQALDDRPSYLIEDPVRSKFYRIGFSEYVFISLLDGKTTVGDAIRLTEDALEGRSLGPRDAAAICRWLLETNLARVSGSEEHACRSDAQIAAKRRKGWQRLNPIVLRIPLLFPNAHFRRITPWLTWLYSGPAFAAWCILAMIAGYCVATEWDRLVASSHRVFAPGNWLWLGLTWVALKGLHEVSHGAVCKKYGGRVREMGLVLILFAPIAYVDVTSSWRFRSKWQRIFTAAAGMYVELLVAAVAVLVWSHTDRGWLNQLCFNVAIMAGVTTVLFNANPLMRFDGYYILSDILGIPNLYTSGQQFLRYWGRRYLLGTKVSLPKWSFAVGSFIRVYAVAAICWRLVVCVGLLIAASCLFHGAGIVLAVFGVVAWFLLPIFRFCRDALRAGPPRRPKWLRLGAVVTGVVLVAAGVSYTPWPAAVTAPAIVDYSSSMPIRAASDGFVREIRVASGDFVEKGQILAVLRNDELKVQLADSELRIQQSLVRSRRYQGHSEIAAFQAEAKVREAMEKQRNELRAEVRELVVRAPIAGHVLGRGIVSLQGMYVEKGTLLLEIGNVECKELHLSVDQDHVDRFAARVGGEINVRLPGQGSFTSSISSIDPSATVRPPHPALCAPFGGPLTVCRKETSTDREEAVQYELVEPRFVGTVCLDGSESKRLRAGQIAVVSFRDGQENVGSHLYRIVSDWVRRRQAPTGNG